METIAGKRGRATSGISDERDPGAPFSVPDSTRPPPTDREPGTGYRETNKNRTKRLQLTAGSARLKQGVLLMQISLYISFIYNA